MTFDGIYKLIQDQRHLGYPENGVELRGLGIGDVRNLLAVVEAAHACVGDAQFQAQVGSCYMIGTRTFERLLDTLADVLQAK